MPLILILVGLIYLIESLSDIIQVAGYKISRKVTGTPKRVFKMAPFHHHLELSGWGEYRIFAVFTIISAVCAALGIYGIIGRFSR